MARHLVSRTAVLALLAAAGATAGCGSGKGPSAAPPTSEVAESFSVTTSSTTKRAKIATSVTTATSVVTASVSRTATAPAFVGGEGQGGAGGAALGVVRAHGYTPVEPAVYHSDQTLRVLVGARSGSADGFGQQAFFFVDGRFIGTDASSPSARVKVVAQSDTEITLGYSLYEPGQPLCCGTGGEAKVRFALDNGKLVPLDPIPPVESKSGTSRR